MIQIDSCSKETFEMLNKLNTVEFMIMGDFDFENLYTININQQVGGILKLAIYQEDLLIDWLEMFSSYQMKGYACRVVDMLKKEYDTIYACPKDITIEDFWIKNGFYHFDQTSPMMRWQR